jgi:hypothetical protein
VALFADGKNYVMLINKCDKKNTKDKQV